MTNEAAPIFTVKEQYDDCKKFECPRLRALCETNDDGSIYFKEGSLAYSAVVRCNNWYLGLSDGGCPVDASVLES